MIRKITFFYFLSFILILNSGTLSAQGWEKLYGDSLSDAGLAVIQTMDGGFLVAGSSSGSTYSTYVIKTDANGDTLWTKTYSGLPGADVVREIPGGYLMMRFSNYNYYYSKISADGDLLVTKKIYMPDTGPGFCYGKIGMTSDNGFMLHGLCNCFAYGSNQAFFLRVNSNGDSLWIKEYGVYGHDQFSGFVESSDGNYILTGYTGNLAAGGGDVVLLKSDTNGNTIFSKVYAGYGTDAGKYSILNSDKGFLIIGETEDGPGGNDIYVIKTDSNGDTLWTKTLGGSSGDYADYGAVELTTGEFLVPGSGKLYKLDPNGNVIWTKLIGSYQMDVLSVFPLPGGGFVLCGNDGSKINLVKYKNDGNIIWSRSFGGNSYDMGYSCKQTTDNGYIISGATKSFGIPTQDVYLIRTDTSGMTFSNKIEGYCYIDADLDCTRDTNESALPQFYKIKLSPGPNGILPYFSNVDSSGYYSFLVDSGTYKVEQILINNPSIKLNCPASGNYLVNFSSNTHSFSSGNDFGNEITFFCPELHVAISSAWLRPCSASTYYVQYCNYGTTATNSYVTISLPAVLTATSSNIPFVNQGNGKYTFNTGSLAAGKCGTFNFTADVSCNAAMGQTVCVNAHIYPDSSCVPPSPSWDKSSLMVEGDCSGDSMAVFVIYNTGDMPGGNMQGPTQYRIFEDNILVASGTVQINGGDSVIITHPACGETIRLEVDQRPGHPGNSHPRATIEGCGSSCGPVSTGMVFQAPYDDADRFVDESCTEIRNSMDPNDKSVSPSGFTLNHYIPSAQALEYKIRFQNTGNDTAFRVVIRDTIDATMMDIASIQPGVSSHPYRFRVYGEGIAEWTFDNIKLVDSTTNEPSSHGFVTFQADQKAGIAKGSIIKNSAGIYFDYNPPVITNTVRVTVFDTTFTSGVAEQSNFNLRLVITPNPARNKVMIIVENDDGRLNGKLKANIFDESGRNIMEIKLIGQEKSNLFKAELKRNSLPAGIYFIVVNDQSGRAIAGKLIFE